MVERFSQWTLQEISNLQEEDYLEQLLEVAEKHYRKGSHERLKEEFQELHPADQAELLGETHQELRELLLSSLADKDVADVLSFLDDNSRGELVHELGNTLLSRVLLHVDDDVAADLVGDLPEDRVEDVLGFLEDPGGVTELLRFAEDSVGSRMSNDFIALDGNWSIEQTAQHLREIDPDLEDILYLYTVDEEGCLTGVVDLRHFILAEPKSKLKDLGDGDDVIRVSATDDQENAAEILRHYDFFALPVVDEKDRMVGLFTADDVLDVQVEEATEDIYLQVGLDAESDPLDTVIGALKARVPWLLINLLVGFFSALIVSFFEGTIGQVAALAAFMPIIAGHGGNTGSQATTLVVRGLALGDIYRRDMKSLVLKEVSFGLIYGLLAGTLTGGLAYFLSENVYLAGVVFVAMVGNLLIAALAGTLIPLGLKALDIDPALASTVWLTTFTDWAGFIMLLGLGTLLISQIT